MEPGTIVVSLIVGVLGGVMTHYLIKPLDQVLSHYSKRYKAWVDRRRDKYSDEICFILAHPDILEMTAQRENRAWIRTVLLILMAFAASVTVEIQPVHPLINVLGELVALLATFVSLIQVNVAWRYNRMFRDMESLRRDIIADEEAEERQKHGLKEISR